jgi:glucokinase
MIFAIDGGGTTWKTALIDDAGELSAEESFPFNLNGGVEGLRRPLTEIFNRREQEARDRGRPIRAIGVGCRGVIDSENLKLLGDTGRMNFFAGHSFRELIETDLPMGAENDAVAATLGENQFGVGRAVRHFLLLTLGTGIGGGIIIDNEIYKGRTGLGGHLGHFPVNPLGDLCGCGNVGCVEQEFSATAFRRRIARVNEVRVGDPPIRDVAHLFDLARSGRLDAERIVRRGVHFLARAISGYANAFDPECVVLAGGIARAGDFLMSLLVEELRPILWRKDPATFVRFTRLGARLGLYGAGAVGARAADS